MRTRAHRICWRALAAIASIVCLTTLLPITPAVATTATTFDGTCTLSGTLTYFPASYSIPQGANIDSATGTCTGSLNGGPQTSMAVLGGAFSQGVFTPVTLEPVTAQGSFQVDFAPNVYLPFVAYYSGTRVAMNVAHGTGLASGTMTGWGGTTATVTISTIGTDSSAPCC